RIDSSVFTPPPPSHLPPLSLHDALPIFRRQHQLEIAHMAFRRSRCNLGQHGPCVRGAGGAEFPERVEEMIVSALAGEAPRTHRRSEEHTSELQSRGHLVCRLLLAKKKTRFRQPVFPARRPAACSAPSRELPCPAMSRRLLTFISVAPTP